MASRDDVCDTIRHCEERSDVAISITPYLCYKNRRVLPMSLIHSQTQHRIIKETSVSFLVSSANLGLNATEEELWELCLSALKNTNSLQTDLIEDNSLLLSLGFQSDLSQNQNPKL